MILRKIGINFEQFSILWNNSNNRSLRDKLLVSNERTRNRLASSISFMESKYIKKKKKKKGKTFNRLNLMNGLNLEKNS